MTAIATAITIGLFIILLTLLYLRYAKSGPTNLPPGPKPLPIIGNFHLLGPYPHRALAKLAQIYGPIMSIHLAQVPAIIISSPHAAKLVLKQYDAVCSDRPQIEAWLYGPKSMSFTPYGDHWRRVRMMCSKHILSASKIAEFEEVRAVESEAAMRKLEASAAAREVVDIDEVVGKLIEDIGMIMVVGSKGDGRYDVKSVISEAMNLAGQFNLADFIPYLGPFDFQGITKKVKSLRKKADEIFDYIIENHGKSEEYGKHKDILSTMLNLITTKENDQFKSFTHENIKAIMFELFAGGIDTTIATTIWALSSLIKNPHAMKKLQEELDVVVGEKQMVEESDLSKLWYLDMVIKETARLYNVVPLLAPHLAMKDVVIEGYTIPAKSWIMVNAWAIGRDPKVWSDNVEEFYPERFIDSTIDLNGHHFELLPFGSGRRICPGWNLGLINVKLMLAKLVHYFEWELPNGMEPQELDMTEEYGLSMPRAKHLLAIPSRRLRAPSSGQVEQ